MCQLPSPQGPHSTLTKDRCPAEQDSHSLGLCGRLTPEGMRGCVLHEGLRVVLSPALASPSFLGPGWSLLLLVEHSPLHQTQAPAGYVPALLANAPCLLSTTRLPHRNHTVESPHTGLAVAHKGQLLLSTHVGPGTKDKDSWHFSYQQQARPPVSNYPVWGSDL